MKLIIDIDKQHFELLQMAVMNGMGDNAQKIIAQGIPLDDILDKIRAEITAIATYKQVDEHTAFIKTGKQVKQMALDIIDKYREESDPQESEE